MCDERPRHSAARDGLHHRSFDLDESMRVQCATHRLHQLAALQENFAHLGIDDEIDVALPVTQFDIREPVPSLGGAGGTASASIALPTGSGSKILAEERDFLDMHGQFAGARAKQVAAHADVVADVE